MCSPLSSTHSDCLPEALMDGVENLKGLSCFSLSEFFMRCWGANPGSHACWLSTVPLRYTLNRVYLYLFTSIFQGRRLKPRKLSSFLGISINRNESKNFISPTCIFNHCSVLPGQGGWRNKSNGSVANAKERTGKKSHSILIIFI